MIAVHGGMVNQKTAAHLYLPCVNQFTLSLLSSHAVQIIAVKLLAVSPSEMCDERTASKMSSFSTAKRNGLSGINIIRMAQLQQYWAGGIGQSDSNFTHTAHLNLPKPQTQPASVTLPAPTLQDLLNPAPLDNTLDDIYGARFLDEDDNDDENASEPTVNIIRSGQLGRLAIDQLVNLAEPKLIARFNPSRSDPIRKAPSAQPAPRSTQEEWSAANSQWATKSFTF